MSERKTLPELIEERANLNSEAQGLMDTAERENRELTQAEGERVDRCLDVCADLSQQIQTMDRDEQRRDRLAEQHQDIIDYRSNPTPPRDPRGRSPEEDERRDEPIEINLRGSRQIPGHEKTDYRGVFTPNDPQYRAHSQEYHDAFRRWAWSPEKNADSAEMRALSAGTSTEGGYLVPTQMLSQLIQAVDDVNFIRGLATVIPGVTGSSVGVPSLDTDPADPTWTGELATGSEDTSMAFGKRELSPHALAQSIKISRKLLRAASMNVENIATQRIAYKVGNVEENAFLTGSGSDEPLGVFTASADGISTGRDVSTDNTTTAMTADGLIEAKFTLKGQYQNRARWMFHRDGVKQISKLKDGEGQYLWQPGLQAGMPDMLLGRPVDMSENAPNTFTTGLYVGILCDWSFYWVADALNVEFQRLEELYAATNQIGLIVRKETDAMPVLEEAFVRVTLA